MPKNTSILMGMELGIRLMDAMVSVVLAVPLIGSVVAYGGLLMLFRLIDAEDLQAFGETLRRSGKKEAARVA